MSSIVIGMEPYQITVEDSEQQLVANRQYPVNFATGEWGMEEEPDFDVLLTVPNLLPKHFRKEHQVVVVYPNQIPVFDFLRDSFGE